MFALKKNISIAILDDDKAILKALSLMLSVNKQYVVSAYHHPAEILEKLNSFKPDIFISDINLPELDGISLVRKIREMPGDHPEIIIITGNGNKEYAIECLRLGAIDFLEKPFSMAGFRTAVERAATFVESKRRLTELLPEKRNPLPDDGKKAVLISKSPQMAKIRQLISMISATNDTSVLITGETGTGKEIIARLIHDQSHRRMMPFFARNCASVPDTLFESEFFGHVKGAFTGADSDRKGWFECAKNSTLFLDEISEIPLPIQPKLLRVLEEKSINPVGSTRDIDVNVRIVAASNADLMERCKAGSFRKDLYYRLNVFSIDLPPLRDRGEDIPLLFDHFLNRYAHLHGIPLPEVRKRDIQALMCHGFPGNVRELRNIAEKFVIMNGPDQESGIKLEDLLNSSRGITATGYQSMADGLEENEIHQIMQALENAGFVIARAARSLKISNQSMLRRIKKYNITIPPRNPKSEL